MAKTKKKKQAARKPQAGQVLPRLQGNLKQLQRDAAGLLTRARKEAVRLSQDQRRALDRVVAEAQQFRADFQKLVRQTTKDLESRSKRVLTTLEKEAEKRLQPVVKRLVGRDEILRREVASLTRRVQELERVVKQHSHATPAAPESSAPLSSFAPTEES